MTLFVRGSSCSSFNVSSNNNASRKGNSRIVM